MSEDAGVDRPRLLHLFSRRKILVDAIDPHCARIVERDQNIFGGYIGADVDWAGRQPYRYTVRRQRASRGINGECGDVMLGSLGPVAGGAAAARYIEIASRRMRPGILYGCRQRDRLTLDQLRARDIHVVMREIGPDICIERDLLGHLLGGSQSRCGHAACDKRKKTSAAQHGAPPSRQSTLRCLTRGTASPRGELPASPDLSG